MTEVQFADALEGVSREQSRRGLDQRDDEDFRSFDSLNREYREHFPFPFIIGVGLLEDRSQVYATPSRPASEIREPKHARKRSGRFTSSQHSASPASSKASPFPE